MRFRRDVAIPEDGSQTIRKKTTRRMLGRMRASLMQWILMVRGVVRRPPARAGEAGNERVRPVLDTEPKQRMELSQLQLHQPRLPPREQRPRGRRWGKRSSVDTFRITGRTTSQQQRIHLSWPMDLLSCSQLRSPTGHALRYQLRRLLQRKMVQPAAETYPCSQTPSRGHLACSQRPNPRLLILLLSRSRPQHLIHHPPPQQSQDRPPRRSDAHHLQHLQPCSSMISIHPVALQLPRTNSRDCCS